ncbi:MAG: hypothetical protein FIA91_06985, partial [Geobacter sp.]|nr:hypothetical protein [Geobacter sp.]
MRFLITIISALLLWGCASSNDSAVTVDASGKHQPGWLTSHGASYLNDASTCVACHGANLTGGNSGVSCSSTTFNGQSCHASLPHPKPWPAHNLATNQLNACSPCHGVGLAGGAVAPACSKCHVSLAPGTAPVLGACVSCHSAPPNGAIFPNISGAHQAHLVLSLVNCSVCHTGGGSGTALHGTVLTVAFPASYNAKTGAAVRNPDGSCANVSCHGGIATKSWRGGRINPLVECDSCHTAGSAAGVPQNNSYYSGEHQKHLQSVGLKCVDCHDVAVV